jgi:hypothetical protein
VATRQAYERGFKAVAGSDATATDDPELQEAELKTLRKMFVTATTPAHIISNLKRAVQTPVADVRCWSLDSIGFKNRRPHSYSPLPDGQEACIPTVPV